jgi:hypothetical protein
LLAVLNSPVDVVAQLALSAAHEGQSAVSDWVLMESLPIAQPLPAIREKTEVGVARIIEITESHHAMRRILLDWLRIEHEIAKPSFETSIAQPRITKISRIRT